MTVFVRSVAATVGSIAAGLALAQSPCKVSDIAIQKLKVRDERSITYLVGKLVNNCASPTGVEVKAVFYGKDNEILKVRDMWPASINNIEARSDFPFEIMDDKVEGYSRVEMRVIAVRAW
jgi:hypothetical protein